jgi:hypothetical protein
MNPFNDPRANPEVAGEIVRQRHERDLERSELEREAQGDSAAEKRRSTLVIVAWIVVAALAILAVLVLMGNVHL